MRKAQTTVEYMITISVIVVGVIAIMQLMLGTLFDETNRLAGSLSTSLTEDGVQ